MAEAGLEVRENSPSDRRSIHVVLIASGRAALARIVDVTSSITAALALGTPVYDEVEPDDYYGMAVSAHRQTR